MSDKPVGLFDFLNSINYDKKDILNEDTEKEYNQYVLNHFLSGSIDTVLIANEMNVRPNIENRLHYDFLRGIVRKRKRFSKWLKPEKLEKIDIIKEYYGYSTEKAKQILNLIDDDEFAHMRKRLVKGGLSAKS